MPKARRARGMFVLLTGQVHLRKLGPQGQESILAVIEPVIMFNEVAVLDGGANLTTAVAAHDCTVWQIRCDSFQALLARYPMIGLGLLRVLARRNRFLVSQVEDLSFRTVQAARPNYYSILATTALSPLTDGSTPTMSWPCASPPSPKHSPAPSTPSSATAASPARGVRSQSTVSRTWLRWLNNQDRRRAPEPLHVSSPDMTKVNDPWLQL